MQLPFREENLAARIASEDKTDNWKFQNLARETFSDRGTKLLKSHAAAVKFAHSALFLILAGLLAWRV